MKWLLIEPQRGDVVRVKVGSIYHYGIYVSDDEVIQFGLPPTQREQLIAKDIVVCVSNIQVFLDNGFIEVGVLDKKEKSKAKKPDDIVKTARDLIGSGEYHILYNNCEHFVNQCVFGIKVSAQVDNLKKEMSLLKYADVYIAKIPEEFGILPNNEERKKEIIEISNPSLAKQKMFAWAVLEFALKQTCDLDIDKLNIYKNSNGKIVCDCIEFSISHLKDLVVVAVSKAPIGVDVEKIDTNKNKLLNKVSTDEEMVCFDNVKNEINLFYYVWTRKEALFKSLNEKIFQPKELNTLKNNILSYLIKLDCGEFIMSIANVFIQSVNCYELKLKNNKFKSIKKSVKTISLS